MSGDEAKSFAQVNLQMKIGVQTLLVLCPSEQSSVAQDFRHLSVLLPEWESTDFSQKLG